MGKWLTKTKRAYLYRVSLVIVPVLVAYDALDADKAPLWLAVVAAVLGIAAPATALANLSPDPDEYVSADEVEIED